LQIHGLARNTAAKCLAALLLCAASAATSAQISLSTAADLALHADPRVRMAEAELEKAKASLDEAHDAYIPSSGISGGEGKSTGVPTSLPVIFSISAQSLLFTFSQRDYIRAAHAGVDAANLALQEARNQVLEDTVNTYVTLDSAERRRDAMAQEHGFATRLVTITEERLTAGQDTRLDLLKNRRTAAQIRLQLLVVEDEIAELSDHLARLIGLPGNHLETVSSSIPPMETPNLGDGVPTESPGVSSAFANARSKQETAFGDSRYKFRPQLGFGANYSRISTVGTNYGVYYPGFSTNSINEKHLSLNALAIGATIQIPFFDKAHEDRGKIARADARRVAYDAQFQQNQFLEGRFKLGRAAVEASARADLAQVDLDIAQAQIDAVLAQLQPDAGATDRPQLTPKDEQSARLQERQRYVDLLDAQQSLAQAQISLMRQTDGLVRWLRSSPVGRPANAVSGAPVSH
jgi:outer membrane protein TolC